MLEYRFAQLTLVSTLLLLFIGATVHPTGSSLACPEWLFVPTCNYELTPAMEGGVLYEHGHRLAAFLVGIFTVGLALLTWFRRKNDRRTRILTLVAVGGVMAQGALGGITVLLGLSPTFSIAHLALAMSFFALVLVIAHRLRPPSLEAPALVDAARTASARVWVGWAAVTLFVQILLGGLVRHTGSALMCLDIPFCNGLVWPPEPLAQIHMVHRFGAVVSGVVTLIAAIEAMRAGPFRLRAMGAAVTVLLVAQIVLGIYSVLTFISIPVVVAHLVVGALLLALTVSMYLRLGDAVFASRTCAAPSPHAGTGAAGAAAGSPGTGDALGPVAPLSGAAS